MQRNSSQQHVKIAFKFFSYMASVVERVNRIVANIIEIQNGAKGILRGQAETNLRRNLNSKISCHIPFKCILHGWTCSTLHATNVKLYISIPGTFHTRFITKDFLFNTNKYWQPYLAAAFTSSLMIFHVVASKFFTITTYILYTSKIQLRVYFSYRIIYGNAYDSWLSK
jgi:hypothetical protein